MSKEKEIITNENKDSIIDHYNNTDILKYSDIYDKYELTNSDRRMVELIISREASYEKITNQEISAVIGINPVQVSRNRNSERVVKVINLIKDILFDDELKNGIKSIKRKLVKRIDNMIDKETTSENFISDMSKQHLENVNKSNAINVGVQVNNNIDPWSYE